MPTFSTVFVRRYLNLMKNTVLTYSHLMHTLTGEEATTWRDGGDGWTPLEVLCHVADFDEFFYGRAVMMLEQDHPQLPAYDHEALAIERAYNQQNKDDVIQRLATSRARFIRLFENLSEEQWDRAGEHPERGHFTLFDALIQVGTHDVLHLEQLTRILREKKTQAASTPQA
jgi:hypothetical protein